MIEATATTFAQEVLQSPVPVLVDFWAPWCGPCRASAPVIETLAKEFEGRAKVVKVNCDNFGQLAASYGVRGIPAFVVFKNGIAGEITTGFSAETENALRQVLVAAL
jgi:thioredoxin 1